MNLKNINISTELMENDIVYAYSTTLKTAIAYRIEDVEIESDKSVQYFAVQRDKAEIIDYIYFTEKDINFFVFKTEKACIEAKEMREKLSEVVKNSITTTDLYDRFGDLQIEGFVNKLIRNGVKI